jgi:5'-nucleotidase
LTFNNSLILCLFMELFMTSVWKKSAVVLAMSAATALAVVACGGSDNPTTIPDSPAAKAESFRLLAFNDFHGHLEKGDNALFLPSSPTSTSTVRVAAGGAEFLAGKLNELRASNTNTLVVSSGDAIGGSPLASAFFRDEPAIELMNLMKVDVNVVGNHEFDKGLIELRRIVGGGCSTDTSDPNLSSCASSARSYAGAQFNFLAANVVGTNSQPVLSPYVIKNVGTQKVAFIGVVTRTTPTIVSPAGVTGLAFLDEATTINRYVTELKGMGIKAIVAVVHEGGQTDSTWNDSVCANARGEIFAIADKLDKEVDIVLSGHTHQGYNCVRNGMRVIQSFSFGRGIAQMDMQITADGNIDAASIRAVNVPVVNNNNTLTAVTSVYPIATPDAAAKRLVDEYVALAAPKSNRVIGQISATIDRVASTGGDHAAGRLIADAQLAATASGSTGSATIALMNPGGVRADFTCTAGPCNLTFGQSFTVQPFANSLVVMSLTGQQIKDLLEQQWTGANATRARILQPSSSLTYTWDNAIAAGGRVSNIRVNGNPIVLTNSYRVTVNSFLADGGDGFTTLIAGTNRLGGAQDIDALINFMAANRPYAPVTTARITRLN